MGFMPEMCHLNQLELESNLRKLLHELNIITDSSQINRNKLRYFSSDYNISWKKARHIFSITCQD